MATRRKYNRRAPRARSTYGTRVGPWAPEKCMQTTRGLLVAMGAAEEVSNSADHIASMFAGERSASTPDKWENYRGLGKELPRYICALIGASERGAKLVRWRGVVLWVGRLMVECSKGLDPAAAREFRNSVATYMRQVSSAVQVDAIERLDAYIDPAGGIDLNAVDDVGRAPVPRGAFEDLGDGTLNDAGVDDGGDEESTTLDNVGDLVAGGLGAFGRGLSSGLGGGRNA